MTTQRKAITWRLATIPVAWLLAWMLSVPFEWKGRAFFIILIVAWVGVHFFIERKKTRSE